MPDAAPLELVRIELGLTILALWHRCVAIGASMELRHLTSYLRGDAAPTVDRMRHDVIVHALNETLLERELEPRLAYAAP